MSRRTFRELKEDLREARRQRLETEHLADEIAQMLWDSIQRERGLRDAIRALARDRQLSPIALRNALRRLLKESH